jgi:Skp family chaperone for outer membrane proteins
MKASGKHLLALVGLLGGAILLGRCLAGDPAAVTAAARIAVCDIGHVFDQYERVKEINLKRNKEVQEIQAEDQRRLKAIDELKTELESLAPGSNEHEARYKEVQKQSIEREAWLEVQKTMSMHDHHRLMKEIYEQIVQEVGKAAEENGIQIVLYRSREKLQTENTSQLMQQMALRTILYASDNVDVTETVLTRLNQAYRAGDKVGGQDDSRSGTTKRAENNR